MKKAKQAKSSYGEEQETLATVEESIKHVAKEEVKTFVANVDQKKPANKLDLEDLSILAGTPIDAKPAVSAPSLAPLPGTVPAPVYEAVRNVSRYNKDQT